MAFFSKKSFIRSHLFLAVLGSVTFSSFNSSGMGLNREDEAEILSSISSVSQRQPGVEALIPLEKQIEDAKKLTNWWSRLTGEEKDRVNTFWGSIFNDEKIPLEKRVELGKNIMRKRDQAQEESVQGFLLTSLERGRAQLSLDAFVDASLSLMKIKYLEHDKKKRTGGVLLSILEEGERVLPVKKRIEIFEEIMCAGTQDQKKLAYPAVFSFFERTTLPIEDRALLGKSILHFSEKKEQKRGILSFFLSCIEAAQIPLQGHVNDALEVLNCRADSALQDRANAAILAIIKNPQSSPQDYINVLQTFLSRSWCWDNTPENSLQIVCEKLLSNLEREDVPLEDRFHYGTLLLGATILLGSTIEMDQKERVRDVFLSILEQPESTRSLTDDAISRRFKFHISRRGDESRDISVFEEIIERGTSAQQERGKNLLLTHLEHDERSRSLTNEHINAFRFYNEGDYYSPYNPPREENLFENIRSFGTPQQKIRAYLILKGKESFLEAQLDFLRSVLLPKAEDLLRFVPPREDLLRLALHPDPWHSSPRHEIEDMFRVLRAQNQQEWERLIEQTIRSCALQDLERIKREEAQIAQNLRESQLQQEKEEEEKKKRDEDTLLEAIREAQRYDREMERLYQIQAQWEEQSETARVNAINWDGAAAQRDQAASMEVHDYARMRDQKGVSLHDAVLCLIDHKLQEKESHSKSPLVLISYEEALTEIESWIRNGKIVPLEKQMHAFRAIKKGLEEVPNAKTYLSKVFTFMKFHSDKMEIWMNGFVGESLSAYETKDSCSPGIEERIVMGVRGVNDEIDLMFKKAETLQAVKTFLTNCN